MNQIICCDWGTSTFRLKLVDIDSCEVRGSFVSEEGVASINPGAGEPQELRETRFLNVLEKNIHTLLGAEDSAHRIPVIISGMASSSIGIRDIPYQRVPFDSKTNFENIPQINDRELDRRIWLIPGLRSENDVMRGEETQWIGLMQFPDFANASDLLCILPGTHSKHLIVRNGVLHDFKTFMTGEYFSLLANHSVLKNSVASAENREGLADPNGFREGVRASLEGPMLQQSFQVRINQLFNRLPAGQNRLFLSGLMIGYELQYIVARRLLLAGSGGMIELYRTALEELGFAGQVDYIMGKDFDDVLIKGQLTIVKNLIR